MPEPNAPTPTPNLGPTPTAKVINVDQQRHAPLGTPAAAPPVPGVDQAVDKTQEALRRLDAALAEKVSGANAAASPEAAPPAQSLSDADQSLAQDLDQIMQGDAAAVNAVLDDVFKEQAAVVQQLDESPRPGEPTPAALAPVSAAVLAAPLAVQATATPPPEAAATVTSPAESPASSPEPAAPEAAAPLVAGSEPPAEMIAVERESAPAATSPPSANAAPVAEVASAAKRLVAEKARAAEATESKGASAANALQGMLARVRSVPTHRLASVLDPIVNVLVIINSPLRKIPASMRPMVDWLALSLLAWVPIVWVLAICLGHKSAPPAAAPLKSGIVLPTLHDESINAGLANH